MKLLTLFAVVFLTGCASGNTPRSLLVLGNSITKYGPNPSLGWTGDWGLAAPSEAEDFAHLTGTALHLPVTVQQPAIEYGPPSLLPPLSVTPTTIVVVEFGDNAEFNTTPDDFRISYNRLLDVVSGANRFACTSTWWTYANMDTIIRQSCEAHGGRYVYIGDLYLSPDNTDTLVVQYAYWGVNDHPRKWGHQHIAERVIKALQQ
jgi:hypothetical protein